MTVLGPEGRTIVSSGDEVANAAARQKFVTAYDFKHNIVMEGENKAMMISGKEVPVSDTCRTQKWHLASLMRSLAVTR